MIDELVLISSVSHKTISPPIDTTNLPSPENQLGLKTKEGL